MTAKSRTIQDFLLITITTIPNLCEFVFYGESILIDLEMNEVTSSLLFSQEVSDLKRRWNWNGCIQLWGCLTTTESPLR
jgi:hypothetical protein